MRRHGGGRPGREGAMDVRTVLLLALAALVLLAVAFRAVSTPLKVLLKVGLNTLLGLAALLLVNATTDFTGLHLGVNLFNGLVVGVLGIPGLVLLLLVQWVVT